jgi:hypothetical protein
MGTFGWVVTGILITLVFIGYVGSLIDKSVGKKASGKRKRYSKKKNKPNHILATPEQIEFWKEMEYSTYRDFNWDGEIPGKEFDFDIDVISMSYKKPIIAYKANLHKVICSCPNFKREKKNGHICKHLMFIIGNIEKLPLYMGRKSNGT